MNDATVADLILRAVAAMREHGELPEVETPSISVSRVSSGGAALFRSNVGQALATAQTGEHPNQSPQAFARAVADYLREVVDLVPAYYDVASVESGNDGSLTITLRGPETQ
jgi:hypothetical protein